MDLLRALIVVSEKAANIARVCRRDEHLFELLVQKKKTTEANPRFVEDFKTLADVLIQEMVKHDIGKQFNELSANIKGEENNVFKNKLGEKICVEVKPSEEETSTLLEIVLNGDHLAATLLAAEVHRDLNIESIKTDVPETEFNVNFEELGVWIDPIDCTAEYVHGGPGENTNNIHKNGLKCVTILIGAFNRTTGEPVMGVINRPFLDPEDFQHSQQCVWGVSLPDLKCNSRLNTISKTNIICISSSEKDDIKKKLTSHGYTLIEASGAGYKILTVILGLADAYILTKGTTFKWDTCAPHAILKSLGGDIINFLQITSSDEPKSIKYFNEESNCNLDGIIVYRDENQLNEIVNILKL
ncbi:inositol polyphosphate 1-phosphatase [Diabrotica virgifera virgifera]|uniref:Inositol polyphosphate 1-phosphatase n=1 Tax=Diabrotica virgifera virgifera TaxID=50390 RepID=A0ABM5KL25_DIAVI|nr:inositol polyphosphate 1-phosphatase [Diabrotica virgifera virgifera]XP_050510900.1 inositol polyphosphate 1-phosphatase [Diabrotica virgifera virgifera]